MKTSLTRPLICIAALTLFSVSAFSSAEEMQKVKLAQNLSPISGVTIIAKNKNFFEKAGLDVQVVNFTSGKQALEATLGGGTDIATTAEAPVTAAAMAKQPIAFIARMEYSDLKTLASVSSGIRTLSDIKGKRIGMTVGTGGEVYTMALLERAGLTKKDVSIVSLRPQDMAAGISANGIDMMNTWEPYISTAKKALGTQVRQLETKGVYAETFNIVTTQTYLKSNRELMTKFVKAMIDAEKWMKDNPEDAITIVAKTVGMNRDDLAPIWSDYNFKVVLDDMTVSVLKAHAAWRLESGNAPTGAVMPDFSKVIFPDLLKGVAADRVTIKSY